MSSYPRECRSQFGCSGDDYHLNIMSSIERNNIEEEEDEDEGENGGENAGVTSSSILTQAQINCTPNIHNESKNTQVDLHIESQLQSNCLIGCGGGGGGGGNSGSGGVNAWFNARITGDSCYLPYKSVPADSVFPPNFFDMYNNDASDNNNAHDNANNNNVNNYPYVRNVVEPEDDCDFSDYGSPDEEDKALVINNQPQVIPEAIRDLLEVIIPKRSQFMEEKKRAEEEKKRQEEEKKRQELDFQQRCGTFIHDELLPWWKNQIREKWVHAGVKPHLQVLFSESKIIPGRYGIIVSCLDVKNQEIFQMNHPYFTHDSGCYQIHSFFGEIFMNLGFEIRGDLNNSITVNIPENYLRH